MSMTRLSDVLWRERHLLEVLLFKLDTEQVLLTNGRTRWLEHATREVETILDQIRAVELDRADANRAVTEPLGLPDTTDLSGLIAAVDEPWATILTRHRDAVNRLVAEIGAIAESNRELLAMSHRATDETLLSLGASTATYDITGHATTSPAAAQLIDQTF